jgi:purine catabolism regulator
VKRLATVDGQSSPVSLGDLLQEEAFGLRLLSGPADAPARPVVGAHTVEVEDPGRWLAEHWVMLTTGVRLSGNPGAQRQLVRQLEEAGVTALGFGVGIVFEQVPAALFEEARARTFPLFDVPYDTPFRELTRFVDDALGRGDAHVFRRLSVLQRYLVDAMREPKPEQAMLERLASFLHATVVILTGDGELTASTGNAPVRELWAEIASHPTGLREVAAAGWHAIATPVTAAAGEPARWLVLTSRRPGFIGKLVKPAAETAAPLLAAMSGLEDIVRSQEQAVRGALLEEALASVGSRDAAELAARAASFGLDFSAPARVVVLRGGPKVDLDALRRQLRTQLDQLRVHYLLRRQGDELVALVQAGGPELADSLTAIVTADPSTMIGIGRGVQEIAGANHSFRDAELAVDRAALEPGRRLLSFDDFDLGTFAVSEIPPDRLAPKVEALMSVLRENPPLQQALIAYFQNDLDVVAAAAVLHLHPNSLRYRLGRIEVLLGCSLKQPSTIAALYLALIAGTAGERPS